MKKFLTVFWSLFLVLASHSQDSCRNQAGFLPADQEIPGFTIEKNYSCFSGDQLYDYIDGGADLFFEYGFVSALSAHALNRSGNRYHIEIYTMTDDSAAYGIYSFNSSGEGTSAGAGDQSRLYAYYTDILAGCHYIRITSEGMEDAVGQKIAALGKLIADRTGETGKIPASIQKFNRLFSESTDMKLVFGTVALGNLYHFGEGVFQGFRSCVYWKSDSTENFAFQFIDETVADKIFRESAAKIMTLSRYSQQKMDEGILQAIDRSDHCIVIGQAKNCIVAVKAPRSACGSEIPEMILERISQY